MRRLISHQVRRDITSEIYNDLLKHDTRIERFDDEFVNSISTSRKREIDLLYSDPLRHSRIIYRVNVLRLLIESVIEASLYSFRTLESDSVAMA